MSAPRSSRRTASPVRVSLSSVLGGDIDGAWWPRTGSMARELPDLIEALYPALGEIVDIKLNWSTKSRTPVLSTISPTALSKIGWDGAHQRLMSLVGQTARTTILVVPAITSAGLAMMVLRHAAARPISGLQHGTPEFAAACRIVGSARTDSAAWLAAPD